LYASGKTCFIRDNNSFFCASGSADKTCSWYSSVFDINPGSISGALSAVFTFADTSFETSQKRAPITKERLFISISFI
jgi:hypothetical protein